MRGKEEHYHHHHHHHLAWSFCWVVSSRELSSLISGMYFFHVPICCCCCCCSCRDCRHSVASAGSVVERASERASFFVCCSGKKEKRWGLMVTEKQEISHSWALSIRSVVVGRLRC
ncbi:hypothetical protein BDL97_07G102400 [Sphagnum fallax]|nr:hypothetical protein BDL97_07G102400 [Sphagnum fallax]